MKLVVGLGNPGDTYERTRHNAGFRAVDALANAWNAPAFQSEKEWNAEITKVSFERESYVLAKPQTHMNLSGEAVGKIVQFYKLNPTEDLVLLYDDLDLPLGSVRYSGVSSGGHNGVQSVFNHLGTEAIARVRIGISGETRLPETDSAAYVLQSFLPEEEKIIQDLLKEIPKHLSQAWTNR